MRLNLLRGAFLLSIAAGVAVGVGSDRVPADPTRPLAIRGEIARPPDPDGPLRIATFNIHGGKGEDGRTDLGRTAGALAEIDIAALQEVRAGWREGEDQATRLGALLGVQSVFIPAERRWWQDRFGNGLLSRLPIEAIHRVPLVNTCGKSYRMAAVAEVRYRGGIVRVLAVHVARGEDRGAQLEAVCRMFLSLERPAILLGDLNSTADDPRLTALLTHPETTAAVALGATDTSLPVSTGSGIDWIIARGMRSVRSEVRDKDASDHPAIYAELELLTPVADP